MESCRRRRHCRRGLLFYGNYKTLIENLCALWNLKVEDWISSVSPASVFLGLALTLCKRGQALLPVFSFLCGVPRHAPDFV